MNMSLEAFSKLKRDMFLDIAIPDDFKLQVTALEKNINAIIHLNSLRLSSADWHETVEVNKIMLSNVIFWYFTFCF